MKNQENKDLVAGRLGDISQSRRQPRRSVTQDGGNNGAQRLGITSGPEAEPARPASQQPSPQEIRRPDLNQLAARRAEDGPKPVEATGLSGAINKARFWKYGRKGWLSAGALVGILAIALIWAVRLGDNGEPSVPQSVSAAPAAAGKTPTTPPQPDRSRTDQLKTGEDKPPGPVEFVPPAETPEAPPKPRHTNAAATLEGPQPEPKTSPKDNEQPPAVPPDAGHDNQTVTKTILPPKKPSRHYITCPAGFKLTGIVQLPTGRFANINGSYVKTGQTVNGAKITKIGVFSVEMELKGERFVIGISAESTKGAAGKN